MKIQIQRRNEAFLMEARNENGNTLLMDNAAAYATPNQAQGLSPMQLLLAAIGGCSTIDIISILEKQRQPLVDIQIEIEGARADTIPKVFEKINLHYTLFGNLDPEKVRKAIELSLEKYCSVSKMLEKTAEIAYSFSIKN
ncbi:OsmC family protein [Hugenholtzia roseola]|uniref:OsmC family protein n=1 Tax=Hugenholtzia roseola TaxID=1002 RepID=UPI0003FB1661|nr:OsmC family protein [Hugenholtzia roseola]